MTPNLRQFLHTSTSFRNEIRELLQSIFVGEMLYPSSCLWLVSPWIRDIEIIDNRTGAFRALEQSWGLNWIRLSDVLRALLLRGSYVVVATRDDQESVRFVESLKLSVKDRAKTQLIAYTREQLHAKGLLGRTYCLSGSMNFTFSGVEHSDELLTFQTSLEDVNRLRLTFHDQYEGKL